MSDETTAPEEQPVATEPGAPEADVPAPLGAEASAESPPEAERSPDEVSSQTEGDEGARTRRKRKRLPRSERRQRVKPRRQKPAQRKPIVRLPKPERPRGRRQERQGTVVSAAGDKTIVVRVDVVKLHPVVKKVIRRSTKLHAHDERNQAKVGDVVRIVETRPLSKLKRWRLREIVEEAK
jgi:small subunit ribosomal protein S17